MSTSITSANSSNVSEILNYINNHTNNLDQLFTNLQISNESKNYLKTRFEDQKDVLFDLLNCLNNQAINETSDPQMMEYATISADRLGLILTSIAKYDCGKKQLIQLMNDLKEDDIKLKFVQPIQAKSQDEYALLSSKSLGHTTTIYVSVQPDRPNPNHNGRCICSYDHRNNTIERMNLDETNDFTEELSFEGYKCGHELSHAIAFVRFYKSQNPRPRGEEVYNKWSGKYNVWKSFPGDTTKIWDMFFKPEEYRNVLGLGLSKTFKDLDNIIGEFDYLNELMKAKTGENEDIIYIRMPYDPQYWDDSVALDICKKKYKQIYPQKNKNCSLV